MTSEFRLLSLSMKASIHALVCTKLDIRKGKPLPRLSQGEGPADIARPASLPNLKRDETRQVRTPEIINLN